GDTGARRPCTTRRRARLAGGARHRDPRAAGLYPLGPRRAPLVLLQRRLVRLRSVAAARRRRAARRRGRGLAPPPEVGGGGGAGAGGVDGDPRLRLCRPAALHRLTRDALARLRGDVEDDVLLDA